MARCGVLSLRVHAGDASEDLHGLGIEEASGSDLLGQVASLRLEAFQGAMSPAQMPWLSPEREIYLSLMDWIAKGSKCLVVTSDQADGSEGVAQQEPQAVQDMRDLVSFGWMTEEKFESKRAEILAAESPSCGRRKRVIGSVDLAFVGPGGEDALAYVSNMAVASKHRRKGIGRMLLEAVEDAAQRMGSKEVNLHVDMQNDAAVGLYGKPTPSRLPCQSPFCSETMER